MVGRILLGIVVVLALLVLAVWASARLSLDGSLPYAKTTQQLPLFDGNASGLRRIVVHSVGDGDGGELTFRARVAGFDTPHRGNLMLLHGFPETSVMWEPLIDAAAAAGYRVIAFDQRGYSPGARPVGADAYATSALVGDVLAVADAVGFDTFHLAGHDWGSAVGWGVVLSAPSRVDSWTALSIPHIAAFGAALQDDPDQQSKSAYMTLFRTPVVAETAFAFNDFAMMRGGLYADHPLHHQAEYLAMFSEPGALTAALNWYRAMNVTDAGNGSAEVATPTLFLWGNADPAVGRKAVEAQRQFMTGPFEVIELDTGHWLMATETERVVSATLAHLAQHPAAG